jgi:hypothetical protein
LTKVKWMSRHPLSPAQQVAVRALHGEDVEIIHDTEPFNGTDEFLDRASDKAVAFVYAVAPAHMIAAYVARSASPYSPAALGFFENHPGKRADGQFGLKAVHWVTKSPGEEFGGPDWVEVKEVWVNNDPASDTGDALVAVARS